MKLTKEQLAALLNGREYLDEITKEEEEQAKDSGLLVIFGQSDDLVELRGAEYEEVGAYEGTIIRITRDGNMLPNFENLDKDDENLLEEYFKAKLAGFIEVEAVWKDEYPPWTFKTELPHSEFTIVECGEPFCRGIVIDAADIAEAIDASRNVEGSAQ